MGDKLATLSTLFHRKMFMCLLSQLLSIETHHIHLQVQIDSSPFPNYNHSLFNIATQPINQLGFEFPKVKSRNMKLLTI